MKYSLSDVSVDAGNISFVDVEYLKSNGAIFKDVPKSCKVIYIDPGTYKIKYNIPNSWNGPLSGSDTIEIESGKFYVGDACYPFSGTDDNVWSEFLNKTDYLHNMGPNGFCIDTGGDGGFEISFEIIKV